MIRNNAKYCTTKERYECLQQYKYGFWLRQGKILYSTTVTNQSKATINIDEIRLNSMFRNIFKIQNA